MAQSTILIDNDKVKVTKWLFDVGDSTGHHIHKNNYIDYFLPSYNILYLPSINPSATLKFPVIPTNT